LNPLFCLFVSLAHFLLFPFQTTNPPQGIRPTRICNVFVNFVLPLRPIRVRALPPSGSPLTQTFRSSFHPSVSPPLFFFSSSLFPGFVVRTFREPTFEFPFSLNHVLEIKPPIDRGPLFLRTNGPRTPYLYFCIIQGWIFNF